ncbi:MAG: CBS domain-containing protein [Asgard group archaeon]|nr:CBS domain-containing protein [Asgard group archaeon]
MVKNKQKITKRSEKDSDTLNENNQEIKENSNENETKLIEFDENENKFKKSLSKRFIESVKSIWNYIKQPRKSLKLLFKQKTFLTYFIAIVSGFVGAGAAWVFSNYIALTRSLFYGLMFNNTTGALQLFLIVLLPTLAAAITAPILFKWAPEAKGHGIPEVMESLVFREGYIKTSTPYLKMTLSGICIGGGLSLGREGPIAQIGGGFSSFLGRKLGLRGRNIKTVVVCGLVAGISATFNAPIGAAIFGLEVLIVSLHADQLIPIIVSSLIANTLGNLILEKRSQPIFEIPSELTSIQFSDYLPYLHWFLLLGVFVGFIAIFYLRSVGLVEKIVHKVKHVHPIVWPIAGGLMTGLLGLISPKAGPQDLSFSPIGEDKPVFTIFGVNGIPRIFGVGYETITALFDNKPLDESWTIFGGGVLLVLVLLVLLKILATGFSVGSGNSGGVFAPSLVIGAASGYFFAALIDRLIPSIVFASQDYALFTIAGLAAVFSGASKAVLTMIFMASEMTHSYHTFIPLMLTCTISYVISKIATKENIYTQKLLQRGINISMAGPTDLLVTYKVKDIMTTDVICVPENMKMREFNTLANTMDHIGYPIINMKGEFQGIVTITHLKLAINSNELDKTVLEAGEKDPYILYPNDTVEHAMSLLYRSDIGRLVVLDSPNSKNMAGIVSNSDVLKCLEIQRVKDLEERKLADRKLHEMELKMVENAIEQYPELKEKVRVISLETIEKQIEKDLLAYLREECEDQPLSVQLEEEYKKHIRERKKRKRTSKSKRKKEQDNLDKEQ